MGEGPEGWSGWRRKEWEAVGEKGAGAGLGHSACCAIPPCATSLVAPVHVA